MLNMGKDIENIRAHLRYYREDPSEKSWSNLVRRLDQDKGKIKLSIVIRYFSIAASIVLLLGLMTWFLIYSGNDTKSWEEKLSIAGYNPEFTVYQHVPKINAWYVLHDWSRIYEGDIHKHFIVTENQSDDQRYEYLQEKGDSVRQ